MSELIRGKRIGYLMLVVFSAFIIAFLALLLGGPITTPEGNTVTSDYFVHPLFSIPAVLLVITAYLLKKRGKERFLAHYLSGTVAVSLTIVAALIGLGVVDHHASHFLFTVNFHLLVAIFVLGIVLTHGFYGINMLISGRTASRISRHKKMAKYVLIVYLIQGALGLSILAALLIFGLF